MISSLGLLFLLEKLISYNPYLMCPIVSFEVLNITMMRNEEDTDHPKTLEKYTQRTFSR
jgi:hypothetical protein